MTPLATASLAVLQDLLDTAQEQRLLPEPAALGLPDDTDLYTICNMLINHDELPAIAEASAAVYEDAIAD